MIVRRAEVSDYAAMIKLVDKFFKTNNFAHLGIDIDIECISRLVAKLTTGHLMLVLETDNREIIGGIGGIIVPFLSNEKIKLFQEIFFHIEDGFRKYSQLLLAGLEEKCRQLNLDNIIMAHPNDGNLEKMERFYKARGYKLLETHFVKKVK